MSNFVHAGIGRSLAPVLCLPDCVNVSRLVAPVRQWYEELGGEVVLLGKPAAVLYEEALRLLNLRKSEVVAIGDSLQHDIAGACAALLPGQARCWCHAGGRAWVCRLDAVLGPGRTLRQAAGFCSRLLTGRLGWEHQAHRTWAWTACSLRAAYTLPSWAWRRRQPPGTRTGKLWRASSTSIRARGLRSSWRT